MTLKEVQALSDEEIRFKVAELAGWTRGAMRDDGSYWWAMPNKAPQHTWLDKSIPNYPQDLNAMYEVEESMCLEDQMEYVIELGGCCGDCELFSDWWQPIHATARQRAEAFVLTMEGI